MIRVRRFRLAQLDSTRQCDISAIGPVPVRLLEHTRFYDYALAVFQGMLNVCIFFVMVTLTPANTPVLHGYVRTFALHLSHFAFVICPIVTAAD